MSGREKLQKRLQALEIKSPEPPQEIISIDPGNRQSGWILFKRDDGELGGLRPISFGVSQNVDLRDKLRKLPKDTRMVIEMMRPRGMPTAAEEMDTMVEIGRFVECIGNRQWSYAFRGTVKCHVATNKATDANVRQALIDRFGGNTSAVGGKKCQKCKGKGTHGTKKIECFSCHGSKVEIADGSGTKRKCLECKGKGTNGSEPLQCPECQGSKWEHPPGPLYGVASHVWPALAIACWWCDVGQIIKSATMASSKQQPSK